MTFFKTVGYWAVPDLSSHSFRHSLSPGLCTRAVVRKTFSNHADERKRWKGEPLFLEGEAEETGDVWWEDEQ